MAEVKQLDVLFVAPPFYYGILDSLSSRSPPLCAASIAAVLQKEGYSVQILDVTWECLTRLSNVKEDVLHKMYEVGCRSIIFFSKSNSTLNLLKSNKLFKAINTPLIATFNSKDTIQVKCSRPKFILRKLKEMWNFADFKRSLIAGKDLLKLSAQRMMLMANPIKSA